MKESGTARKRCDGKKRVDNTGLSFIYGSPFPTTIAVQNGGSFAGLEENDERKAEERRTFGG